LIKLAAIGRPIAPTPMKPTCMSRPPLTARHDPDGEWLRQCKRDCANDHCG